MSDMHCYEYVSHKLAAPTARDLYNSADRIRDTRTLEGYRLLFTDFSSDHREVYLVFRRERRDIDA